MASASYYTHDVRSAHLGGSLLFHLPVKILDAMKYFGLYKFVHRMGTDPVLTAMTLHRCCEGDREETAVCDCSFRTTSVRVNCTGGRRAHTSRLVDQKNVALLSIFLPVVCPYVFPQGVQRTSLVDITRDFDRHPGQIEHSGEASGRGMKSGWIWMN